MKDHIYQKGHIRRRRTRCVISVDTVSTHPAVLDPPTGSEIDLLKF